MSSKAGKAYQSKGATSHCHLVCICVHSCDSLFDRLVLTAHALIQVVVNRNSLASHTLAEAFVIHTPPSGIVLPLSGAGRARFRVFATSRAFAEYNEQGKVRAEIKCDNFFCLAILRVIHKMNAIT